ncbi:hypothetical protein EM20IM_04875 [Candidatus Methylacidiphilum infernorum]|uniref:Uncharacterized protein n=1 Tax=Candidatus Methylacidiphilum infernorum TaxID=511746 RepID=A0ABX7PYL5_9BACT|nr:hypothetical protein [Candidatus Methylacidiphilum infernorum]QSR87654.1 hypothetical protein EM20IM_04875 [Candidatus Methylacidiphilum infernorum]
MLFDDKKMKKWDKGTLYSLAGIICSTESPGPPLEGKIKRLFSSARLHCPKYLPSHNCNNWDRYALQEWTYEMLLILAQFPENIEEIIKRLADPREYAGDPKKVEEVVTKLNKILAVEGYEIKLDGIKPQLIEIEPRLIQDPEKPLVFLNPPDFTPLTNDQLLRKILHERWMEVRKCWEAGAYVAALVMMGSLLEGVLLAVAEANPEEANRSNASPKDMKGQPKAFCDWMLNDLINVAHERGWIQGHVKKFSHILREYRNIVHPKKQREMEMLADKDTCKSYWEDTCKICWEVVQAAVNNVVNWQKKNRS